MKSKDLKRVAYLMVWLMELRDNKENCQMIRHLIETIKNTLFSRKDLTEFFKSCLIPRFSYSMTDAIYCSQFVKLIIDIGLKNFSKEEFYRYLVSCIPMMTEICTDKQITRFAVFLRETILNYGNSEEIDYNIQEYFLDKIKFGLGQNKPCRKYALVLCIVKLFPSFNYKSTFNQ